jgi:hypothetical protein
MKLQNRIELLTRLSDYLLENPTELKLVKENAFVQNGWFIREFVEEAISNITTQFLNKDKLAEWIAYYHLDDYFVPKNIGIVMAGNIPLVGFHDFLSVFISGHHQTIKLSSKDEVLLKHIIEKLYKWDPDAKGLITFAPMLKGCDGYIATGSNNSARYFEYYFSKYPSIIRRNRTSIAILNGQETKEELNGLSDDVHKYFGLGCRNVTKIYVPEGYDFVPLIRAFDKYAFFADHNKYKNNYDYNLSLQLLNGLFYMSSTATLLVENDSFFSPISQLNYSFYNNSLELMQSLAGNENIQCIAGIDIPFGHTQCPGLIDYADGIDTMQFLLGI